ncbi:AtpZ/AtpI family protein [Tianweitania sediminis]|uniref:ATP synthase protein I n=1 Tax=Tianweitania sediminis TaxID=1502156 RepID=A0A8J7UKW0_9HYPH|nr:AtpZ/AtpI family protein [Tianweitania sediminis]MBP0438742.1 AtpZ/AtpI family protein [Tianweitania sediminis]
MAKTNGPDNASQSRDNRAGADAARDDSLDGRRRDLGARLAQRRAEAGIGGGDARSREATGYGQAMRLSSEFIAGIVVGTGLGWIIDRVAGTSPWGLIIFLLLGFGAGVLNVLRSAGMIADAGLRASRDEQGKQDRD